MVWPFEAENRAVHIRLAEQHAGIVHQIARREIVRAVDDDVVVLEKIERVFAGQARLERIDLDRPDSDCASDRAAASIFGLAHIARCRKVTCRCRFVKSTTSKSTSPDAPHARRGQIKPQRRAQSARADAQHFALASA